MTGLDVGFKPGPCIARTIEKRPTMVASPIVRVGDTASAVMGPCWRGRCILEVSGNKITISVKDEAKADRTLG